MKALANLLLAALVLLLMILSYGLGTTHPARAHDIWTDAREYNRPTGFPCCGGDPVKGDCEGLTEDQVWDQANGDVVIYSPRYQARILIPADRVMVDLPRYTGADHQGEALDPLVRYAAHYCGVRRPSGLPPEPRNPDPGFLTYCFFRNGGGV